MPCRGLPQPPVPTCVNLSLHLCGKATSSCFNLICASVPVVQHISMSTETNIWLNPLSPAGAWGGGEPQLLSDVNAAQTLCVCGHSPSDRSNQLMGYLTLC